MLISRIQILAAVCLLAAFAWITYWPALAGPFTFDDYPNIVFHPGAQPDTWRELGDSLGHPNRQARPVARLTLGLNYLASGLAPSAYRATNIAIHAATAVLLFLLLAALARAPRAPAHLARNALAFAFAGALLWTVHPANTQAVSYIVQRMTSLAGLFYLATLFVFAHWRMGKLRARFAVPLIGVLWSLALGSKLHAVSAPAAWWLLEVAFFTGFSRRNLRIGGIIVAGGLAVAWWQFDSHLRFLFLEHPRRGYSGLERMLTEARVLWHYVSLVVWPDAQRLLVDYDYPISRGLTAPFSTLLALLGLVATTAVAVVAVHRRRALWLASGWLFFLLASSPEASFVLFDPIFEHRLYLPSALLVPGLASVLFVPALYRAFGLYVRPGVLVLAAVLSWQTMERNGQWARPTELWSHALGGGGKEGRARANALAAALGKARADDVLRLAGGGTTAADSEASIDVSMHNALARTALIQGRFEDALELARQRLQAARRDPQAAFLYGMGLVHLDRLGEARDMARQLQDNGPESPMTAVLQALIQVRGGAVEAGVARLRRWLTQNSERSVSERNFVCLYLANASYWAGDAEQAMEHYRGIVRSSPQTWSAWINLAKIYRANGYSERAERIERHLRDRGVSVDTLQDYSDPMRE